MDKQDCPFCPEGIESQKDRVLTVMEHILVLLSNPRLMPGHTLVIPKRHVPSLSELTEDEREELFNTAILFQEKIEGLHDGGGCDLAQHDRPFMPTTRLTVPQHAHIHLRPRTWQDDYYERVSRHETEVFRELPLDELEKFLVLLGE